jgi:hypothetical protein
LLVASCGHGSARNTLPPIGTSALLPHVPSSATPPPALRLLRSPAPLTSPVSTTAAPLDIALSPPDCREMLHGALWCLGLIQNTLPYPIEQVTVRITLITAEGAPVAAEQAPLTRGYLLPGERAPYAVAFPDLTTQETIAGPVVEVARAQAHPAPGSLARLAVSDLEMTVLSGGLYRVVGTVTNTGIQVAEQLSVVVTGRDGRGQVAGFRQWRWPDARSLAPGERLPFEVTLIAPDGRLVAVEAGAEGYQR